MAGHGDTPDGLVGAAALPDFVGALKKPRKILILVKAGRRWTPSSSSFSEGASSPATSWWTAATVSGPTPSDGWYEGEN